MSDKKPNESGPQPGTPAAKAKTNGTTPTVTARRPISKDEYARTTKASPDATAVIPAVRDDRPSPAPQQSRPEVDDRPTQTFRAVTDSEPTPPKPAPEPEQKRPEQKKPQGKKPAKQSAKKPPSTSSPAAPVAGAAAAGGVAGAAATTPPASPVAAPKPASPAAAASPAAPSAPPKTAPEQKKPQLKRPEPKTAPAKTSTPAAESKTSASADAAAGRSARLKLRHIEPWSVTKMAFVVSVALMIVSVVAVTVFWIVLQITGVWGALNDSVSNVLADDAAAFDVTDFLGFGRVVGVTLLISSLNVIFMTALATIAAHLYNLAAGILGGIELTFGERK